jgi:hypothetical protein
MERQCYLLPGKRQKLLSKGKDVSQSNTTVILHYHRGVRIRAKISSSYHCDGLIWSQEVSACKTNFACLLRAMCGRRTPSDVAQWRRNIASMAAARQEAQHTATCSGFVRFSRKYLTATNIPVDIQWKLGRRLRAHDRLLPCVGLVAEQHFAVEQKINGTVKGRTNRVRENTSGEAAWRTAPAQSWRDAAPPAL